MIKIVSVLKPFELKQKIFVMYEGEVLEEVISTVDYFNTNIFILLDKYKIEHVDICGPKSYCLGIKENLQKAEMAKYNKNNLKINII